MGGNKGKNKNYGTKRGTYKPRGGGAGASIMTTTNALGSTATGTDTTKSPLALTGSRKTKGSLNKRVKRIEKTLSCVETKYTFLQAQSFTSVRTVPQYLLLNGLARGSTVQQRSGDAVRFIKLNLRGILTTNTDVIYRIMIIAVKQANYVIQKFADTTPAEGYLFTSVATVVQPYQMFNFVNTNVKDFTILYDQQVRMGTAMGDYQKQIQINKKLSLCTQYKGGNAGDITDINQNSIYLWILSNSTSTNTGGLVCDINLMYEDM